ncbi:hypothetical protein C7S10_16030 [Nocardioides currus]|uniref:Mce-associated membrane protein n=2 Tax=Nocardioides currus TaxID=2133958 RepID=A0A2R7YW04_9ACTN|nr:hypothetical protein C7S10_16030 [Nocardioides currus]
MNLRRYNLVLLLLGVALGAALAVLLAREPSGDEETEQGSAPYAEVERAATAEVQAFLGIDHELVDEQAQTVLDGATGDFEEQYAAQLDSLKQSARAQESTAVATVLEVGISEIDRASATVLVAADTEVTSKSTAGEPRTVPWRIQLQLVEQDGRWLTSGLRFVG